MASIMGMWRTVMGSMNANCLPDRSILKRARKWAPAPVTASNGRHIDDALCRFIHSSAFKLLTGMDEQAGKSVSAYLADGLFGLPVIRVVKHTNSLTPRLGPR